MKLISKAFLVIQGISYMPLEVLEVGNELGAELVQKGQAVELVAAEEPEAPKEPETVKKSKKVKE